VHTAKSQYCAPTCRRSQMHTRPPEKRVTQSMPDSPALIALRKTLAETVEENPEEKSRIAETVIAKILDAMETGVCAVGDWEMRCLAGAIISIRGRKYDQARTLARRSLWQEENRTVASIAKFPLRPGMSTVEELKRELAAASAERRTPKAV
jgi:hypothetical protein